MKSKEVTSYKTKSGEKLYKYRIRYKDRNGHWKEKSRQGFQTEKAALREVFEVKNALLNGADRHIENDSLTVAQWVDMWFELNQSKWKETTKNQREMAIRLYFKPMLGKYKLQKLDKITYQRVFIEPLRAKLKISSIQLLHNLFKVCINSAVEEEILLRNRFSKVVIKDPHSVEEKKLQYYTPEQLELFLETAKSTEPVTSYLLFKILAFSGMRKGEALGLQWKHVKFETNTIIIAQTRDNVSVRSPKTKNSYRIVSMDTEVMNELKAYRTWCKSTMLEYGIKWTDKSFVFISYQNGTPYASNSPLHAMRRVQKKADLPRIPVHGLRHTHATLLMLNPAINVKSIAERLGNTVDMIHSTYGHILEKSHYETMLAFSEVMKQQKSALKIIEK